MRRSPIVRMTKRGFGMLVFGAATSVGGLLLGIPEATITGMLMAATALATGVVIILAAFLPPGLTIRRVVGSPSPTQMHFVGDDVPVDVVVRPRRRTPSGELVEIALDDLAIRRGARSVRLSVRPLRSGERTTAHYRVTLRQRGTLRFLPCEWRRSDPLGLFWFSRRLDNGSQVNVAPATVQLSADAVAKLNATRPRPTRGRRSTDPFSLRELRPHVSGEDLRRVHWATSAKRNMLMVRQPETMRADQTTPIVLLFDARLSSHDNTLELALSIATTLVVALGEQFRATVLTSESVITTTTVHETLLVLSGVQREPTGGLRTRGHRGARTDADEVGAPIAADIVVTGPLATEWNGTQTTLILRAGLAPLDSSAWGPGAPTREALGVALSTSLCQQSSPPTPISSAAVHR